MIKKKFFEQFSDVINSVDVQQPGKKKQIYAAHYSYATKDHLRHFHFIRALRYMIIMPFKGGALYWGLLFGYIKESVSAHIKLGR